MLCDRQFQYTLGLLYICVETHKVHRNNKCSVFHICLFGERYDFCDLDIVCSSESTNFVKHRRRFYWIIKRKPNIYVLTRGWVMQFPTLLQVWVSHFCAEGRGWATCYLSITFPNAPAHPSPPLLFDQSLRRESTFCQLKYTILSKGYKESQFYRVIVANELHWE